MAIDLEGEDVFVVSVSCLKLEITACTSALFWKYSLPAYVYAVLRFCWIKIELRSTGTHLAKTTSGVTYFADKQRQGAFEVFYLLMCSSYIRVHSAFPSIRTFEHLVNKSL